MHHVITILQWINKDTTRTDRDTPGFKRIPNCAANVSRYYYFLLLLFTNSRIFKCILMQEKQIGCFRLQWRRKYLKGKTVCVQINVSQCPIALWKCLREQARQNSPARSKQSTFIVNIFVMIIRTYAVCNRSCVAQRFGINQNKCCTKCTECKHNNWCNAMSLMSDSRRFTQ